MNNRLEALKAALPGARITMHTQAGDWLAGAKRALPFLAQALLIGSNRLDLSDVRDNDAAILTTDDGTIWVAARIK